MQLNCSYLLVVILICLWRVDGYLVRDDESNVNNASEVNSSNNSTSSSNIGSSGISFTTVVGQIFEVLSDYFLSFVRAEPVCQCSCGLPKISPNISLDISPNISPRIVGGQMTEPNEFPWMARLSYYGNYYCAGTLINDRYVVTAAHCVNGKFWYAIRVSFGEHDRCNPITPPETRYIISANSLIFSRAPNLGLDIALLRLNKPVIFNHNIQPICLPKTPVSTYEGKNATVAGWGLTSENGRSACVLRAAQMPVMSNTECFKNTNYRNISNFFIVNNMMCAGYSDGGVDSCQGDSGGPLMVVNDENRYELAGVVSFGIGCARPNYPGIYTRVTRYINWIKANTRDACNCEL